MAQPKATTSVAVQPATQLLAAWGCGLKLCWSFENEFGIAVEGVKYDLILDSFGRAGQARIGAIFAITKR
jgi:hypothetical protein